MKKNEIIALIRGSTGKNEKLPLADLLKLNDVANVFFDINRETNEYFYRIKIDDLIDKEFEEGILTENGWKLSPDENEILFFIN